MVFYYLSSYNIKLADVNGDGLPDLVQYQGSSWQIWQHNPTLDQLTTVTNGLGAQTVITYKPLTDSTVYTKGTGAAFPEQDYQGPIRVVSQYTTSNGIGNNTDAVIYAYSGARVDIEGRGFVGFSQVTSTDSTDPYNVLRTVTTFSQDWPYLGMIVAVNKYVNNALVDAVSNTLASYNYPDALGNSYSFAFVQMSVQNTYELPANGGGLISTVTTGNDYYSSCATNDAYCDLMEIYIVSTGGGTTFRKITTNIYDYSGVSSWILGRLIDATVANSNSTEEKSRESAFTYYPTGLLETEVIEPHGNVGSITNITQTTTYTYDGFGNKTGVSITGADLATPHTATAADNASSSGAYQAGIFQTSLTNALNQGETRVYDARYGTVAKLTGPNGLSTNWTYDTFGRKILESRADATSTSWSYNMCSGGCPSSASYYVVQSSAGTPTVTVYYDQLDREIRTQTVGYGGTTIYKDTVYNALGHVDHVSRPYYSNAPAYWTYYSYDALGRVTSVSLPTASSSVGSPLATTSYSPLSTSVTAYRNGTALTTTKVTDVIGEVVSVTDANGNTTTYQYDPFSNLTQVTDQAGNISTMTYDIRGRKLTMNDPDMGAWQYTYDTVGDLMIQTDANGKKTKMTYDSLGRMTERNEWGNTEYWIYDQPDSGPAIGKLSYIIWSSDGGNSIRYTYDQYGRPTGENTALSSGASLTLSRTYDTFGRVSTITYPSNYVVNNNYDLNGYLMSVTDAANGYSYWHAPSYTAEGQYTAYTLGNNLTTVNQYDPATGLLLGISTGVGTSSAVQNLTYTNDTLGNLSQRVDGNQSLTETFSYDNLNRLHTYAVGSLPAVTVDYDSTGNITSKSDVGTYAYDPLHKHAVNAAGSGIYTYDANGNQLTGPNGRSLTYSSFNQPLSITQGGNTHTFTYGPDRLRLTETTATGTTYFINPRMDQGPRYEEVDNSNGVIERKNYIYAGHEFIAVFDVPSSGAPTVSYYHKDNLGSIVAITDGTGTVTNQYSYDAWGKRRNTNWTAATSPIITTATIHGFTGHEMMDDIGLIDMNGRVYDPTLGRFLTADPTMQDPEEPQNLNRYTYADNNPVTYTDPSGFGWLSSLWKNVLRPVLIAAVVIVAAYVAYGYIGLVFNPLAGAAAGGFTAGFLGSGGNLQAGLYGALTGAVFGGIGQYGDQAGWGNSMGQDGFGSRVLAHAVGGGMTGALQGQKFLSSAMAAGAGEWAGLAQPTANDDLIYKTMEAGVIGGTASVIGGGNFANGAKTAAYGYLFNTAGKGLAGAVEELSSHVLDDAQSLVGGKPDYNSNGQSQCVTLIKTEYGAPASSTWTEGDPVTPGANIEPGTAIATFVDGVYPNWSTGDHAAIYMGQTSQGIIVIDQWNGIDAIEERTIPWTPRPGASLSNNGSAYSVILW